MHKFGEPTYSRRSAKIQKDLALFKKPILLVQLHELEGSTSTIAFLLGKLIPLVETTFAVLFLDCHRS